VVTKGSRWEGAPRQILGRPSPLLMSALMAMACPGMNFLNFLRQIRHCSGEYLRTAAVFKSLTACMQRGSDVFPSSRATRHGTESTRI
jgi:hypothetical protein